MTGRDDGLVRRTLADLNAAGGALLIDLEFTCWEDSLRTDWGDPAHPAEVIEIGLATYRADTRAVTGSFTSLVRPVVNPALSDYCRALLHHIAQRDIEAAETLPAVLGALDGWLRALPAPDLPTCGWGGMDRVRLARNATALGVSDPLAGRPHIDLRQVLATVFDHPRIERDHLRALKHLPPNPRRHRALDDALDLVHFLGLLLESA